MGSPAQTEANPRSQEEPRRSRPCLEQLPQLSGVVPSLFLGLGLYSELSTPALCWDGEAALVTRDTYKGRGLDQRRGANQASSECAVPSVLACVEMPMNTSSHSSVHTLPVCVITPAPCL